MISEQWRQLAELIVDRATDVRAGEHVLIDAVELETLELARAIHERSLERGAIPYVQLQRAAFDRALLSIASESVIGSVPEIERFALEWADVYVGLRGARNPSELAGIDVQRLAAHRRARGALSALRNEQTRWVLLRIPTEPLAQQAEMSLEAMERMFFAGTVRDWEAERRRMEPLREQLQQGDRVRILADGTDLTFSTTGRTYVIGAGEHNLPDGEIYTAPVEESVQGTVTFGLPAVYSGRRLERVRLRFERGVVVEASAATNGDLLDAVLRTDAGASRLGEFGIGANPAIDHYSMDILYDEKMGGTVHLALGRAYPECGGVNQSAIHWDFVLDLRASGEVRVDDEVFFRDGRWAYMG